MSTDWHLFSAACTKESACEFMACLGTHDYGGVRALSLGTGQRVYGTNTQYWHIHPERGAQSQCLMWDILAQVQGCTFALSWALCAPQLTIVLGMWMPSTWWSGTP